jgi:hypothetical protein
MVKPGIYQTQVQTDVAFSAFMAAVATFFAGLLITRFESFDIAIKVPVAYLIVSMFSFLFSCLILGNSASEITAGRLKNAQRHLRTGYILAEYLGVYMLVFAVPMVINVVTTDLFLRGVTIISAIAGIGLYQFSHFSLLEKHFRKSSDVVATLIIIFQIALFTTQYLNVFFMETALFVLLLMFIIAILAAKTKMIEE